MPYHLENTQLRVVHKYVRQQRNKAALETARFIILEHILPTTEEFVKHLRDSGAEIHALLAKPYSIDTQTLASLENEGFNVIHRSYQELEESDFLDQLLQEAINLSKRDDKQIVIVE